jgi:hypothetical protein
MPCLRPTPEGEECMNQEAGRKYAMGTRALSVHEAQPDSDPGTTAAAAKLKEVTARFTVVAAAQRNGLVDVRASSAEKMRLRQAMLSGPIAHLAEVGREAAQEDHELGKAFRFKPGANTFLAFRTAAGGMAEAAQTHRDTLVKYGLAVPVLEQFVQMLNQFDAAAALGTSGRTAHVAATRELDGLATQIVRTVRVMDVRNRQRFQGNAELLGSWISATRVLGTHRGAPSLTPPDDSAAGAGEVKPAA